MSYQNVLLCFREFTVLTDLKKICVLLSDSNLAFMCVFYMQIIVVIIYY